METVDESGTRESLELPGGIKLEVRRSHRHHIEQTVSLEAPDPEYAGMRIEATVSASVSTYKNEPAPPQLHFSTHGYWSRKQWELAKRLGDQAWDEYEKRFPQP